jgi:hypothetical protein
MLLRGQVLIDIISALELDQIYLAISGCPPAHSILVFSKGDLYQNLALLDFDLHSDVVQLF